MLIFYDLLTTISPIVHKTELAGNDELSIAYLIILCYICHNKIDLVKLYTSFIFLYIKYAL